MKFLFLIFICLLTSAITEAQTGADVGYTYSQSASFKSHKARIGLQLFPEHKFGLTYSKTSLLPADYEDQNNYFFRLSYRYKIDAESNIHFDYKKIDDSYFFEGTNFSGQYSTKFFSYESDLDTQLNFKIETQNRFYSKNKTESFNNVAFDFGFDQELPKGFFVGADISISTYQSQAQEMKAALKGRSVMTTDLNTYANTLSQRTFSFYGEFTHDIFSIGANVSLDTPLVSTQAKYSTFEIYGDLQVQANITLNASVSRGKSVETNSSSSSTTSLGLQYQF